MQYIENLKEAVAIQSVSAWPHKRSEVKRMIEWAAEKFSKLGVKTEIRDIGKEKLHDGSEISLPPVLLGTLTTDPKKKTVLSRIVSNI